MPLLLQGFHQQTLGAFDRDSLDSAVLTQALMKLVQASDVMGEAALMNHLANWVK
jgi:hypothetical protein